MSNFCILPWIHICTDPSGGIKPCCIAEGSAVDKDGKPLTLNDYTIYEIFNSNYFENLRQEFLKGEKPEICKACWKDEEIGSESKRMRENIRWKHKSKNLQVEPVFFDFKLGNTCNLMCRICSHMCSSKLAKEMSELTGKNSFLNFNKVSDWVNDESFWLEIEHYLPNVEQFEFYGGEPFLNKKHVELLKFCISKNYAKNISIHYNTNGTIYPTELLENILPHFKNVSIMISADDIGTRMEYNRYPAKWEIVSKNILKMNELNHLIINVCMTVSVFTVFYLEDMIKWCKKNDVQLWFNTLHQPYYYNIGVFPLAIKETIYKKLIETSRWDKSVIPYLDLIMNNDLSKEWTNFLQNVKLLDNKRNQKFKEVFPELYTMIVESGYDI